MLKRRRGLPSPALVIASLALILAVGGGGFALAISTQKVKTVAKKQANKRITARAPGLSVAHAGTASTASTATNATNSSQLGGVPASGYTRSDCASITGQVKGFARIDASSSFSSTFTTDGVEVPYNCSGGTVEAERIGIGHYEVRFNNSPVGLAIASPLYSPSQNAASSLSVTVQQEGAGLFDVWVNYPPTDSHKDDPFAILTP